jgi:thymidylate kinase
MGLYQKRERVDQKKIKGLGLAHKLGKQWQRYLLSRHYRACGKLVIFDRYSYDALLSSPKHLKLKSRIHRWLLAHCCPPPDLILFLDAPGELLYARKGEHNPVALENQRQQYLHLRSKLPQMVVVDATLGAESVQKEVTRLVWQQYMQQFG